MENDVVSVPPESWQTESEYVYGPDYVDEFVLQSSPNGQAGTVTQGVPADGQRRLYMLQDANFNVMAILDESGGVLEQYQWDPYGTLAVKDTLVSSGPTNRVGHQGLFFHSFTTADCLPLNADGLYYNRNRWYSPKLGRFTSKDPNETGALILRAYAMNGQSALRFLGAFEPARHFENGMSLYLYLLSNPYRCGDPLGLMPTWLANTILWATGGQQSWLDDRKQVQMVSDICAWGGSVILMFTPPSAAMGAMGQVGRLLKWARVPKNEQLGRALWGLAERFRPNHPITQACAAFGFGFGAGIGIMDAATGGRTAFVPMGAQGAGASAISVLTNLIFGRVGGSAARTTMALPVAGLGGAFVGYNVGTLVTDTFKSLFDAIYYEG